MQISEWQTGASNWSAGSQQRNMLQFYWLGWSENPPGWGSVIDIYSPVFACLSNRHKWDSWREGWLFSRLSILNSSLPSLHTSSYSALHYGRPCPPKWGRGLAKVVNGQPEHVIGAHPWIINVLQKETLMETNDGVIICLPTHTKTHSRGSGQSKQ